MLLCDSVHSSLALLNIALEEVTGCIAIANSYTQLLVLLIVQVNIHCIPIFISPTSYEAVDTTAFHGWSTVTRLFVTPKVGNSASYTTYHLTYLKGTNCGNHPTIALPTPPGRKIPLHVATPWNLKVANVWGADGGCNVWSHPTSDF